MLFTSSLAQITPKTFAVEWGEGENLPPHLSIKIYKKKVNKSGEISDLKSGAWAGMQIRAERGRKKKWTAGAHTKWRGIKTDWIDRNRPVVHTIAE